MPVELVPRPHGYAEWLVEVKARVHAAQQRAVLAVNRELVLLYWQLGKDLLDRQARESWGSGVIEQVSADLRAAFPEMKGFSPSNLKYMRAFAEAWPDFQIRQQAVGELPWGHNVVLLSKLPSSSRRSSASLTHKQPSPTVGRATSSSTTSSSEPWSARERPSPIHLKLRCYVVIEIKGGKFKPEHTGQLSFYLTAVDAQVKAPEDNPTIGLLLCKSKNKIVAEYALRNSNMPMGVAEYQLVESLPKDLETNLPRVEAIERELGEAGE